MKTSLLIAGLAAIAIPGAAFAQSSDCVRDNNNNRVAGTVLGALGGAVLGGAVAGNGHKNDGALVGAAGGAIAGNVIAGQRSQPCPSGYSYAPAADRRGPPPPPPPRGERRDFWYGAPEGIHERIDFMQNRVDRSIRGGWLSRREARDIGREMRRLREEDRRLEYQDGGRLSPQDRRYLDSMLDNLSQRLHWAEHNDRY